MTLLTALGTAKAAEGEGQELTIVAPQRMTALCEALAAGFSADHPETTIKVIQDRTAGGVNCLVTGLGQIAAVARPVSAEEALRVRKQAGQHLVSVPIALDAVMFFVHSDNPFERLDFITLRRIYSGQVNRWDRLGVPEELPIWRVVPPPAWGSTAAFERRVLAPASMGLATLVEPTGLEVISVVAGDKRALGFCGLGFRRGVKVLPVARDADSEPVLPTPETVQTQTYPVTHYLYWCFAGTPTGQVRELLKYAAGPAGQEVIRAADLGCVPLPIVPVKKTPEPKLEEGS